MIETRDLHAILISACKKLERDFAYEELGARLDTIRVKIVDAKELSHTLCGRKERRFYHVPAYYDPNKHVIYLNETMLFQENDTTVFIICYHELLHAISHHRNYQEENTNIFQSGAKIEQFSYQFYNCSNRLLNEGIVQFLTNYYNNADDNAYAYSSETKLIRKAAQLIGMTPFKRALLFGNLDSLESAFDGLFGAYSFRSFSKLLDKKEYAHAEALLTPLSVMVLSPLLQESLSSA
ncbi:MAG TPA: hypothetical protein VGE59_01650 [Patescibacteria group bacterium]